MARVQHESLSAVKNTLLEIRKHAFSNVLHYVHKQNTVLMRSWFILLDWCQCVYKQCDACVQRIANLASCCVIIEPVPDTTIYALYYT